MKLSLEIADGIKMCFLTPSWNTFCLGHYASHSGCVFSVRWLGQDEQKSVSTQLQNVLTSSRRFVRSTMEEILLRPGESQELGVRQTQDWRELMSEEKVPL